KPASDAGAQADASTEIKEGTCQLGSDAGAPEYLTQIGCTSDFQALASQPIDADIPGSRSGKVVLDTSDNDALYFQNSNMYQIHYDFASTHLSGNGHPLVEQLSDFNATEYYSPD